MMQKYAANNLMMLRKAYPNIYNTIRNKEYNSDIVQISHNRSNQVVLQISDGSGRVHWMYSRYDVHVEVEKWLESIKDELRTTRHVLFCGLGLGYHLRAFIERYPDIDIYLYEPDHNALMAAIECVDLRDILNHKRIVVFATGQDTDTQNNFVKAVFDTINDSMKTIILPAYSKIYHKTIKHLQETVSRIALSYTENLRTFSGLQVTWAQNIVLNMEKVMNSFSFSTVKGTMSGIPAVIAGSGPSLDMEIEWLRKLKNKVLIIAAGSSIQSLLHHGIKPDLVVSMDPKIGNLRVFNNVSDRQVPFLFIPNIHNEILDRDWQYPMHAIFSNDELTKYWMRDIHPDLVPPQFLSSATVTGTAIQAAVYMGCSEIVLVGQDFSYPEDRHYAQGVTHRSSEELTMLVRDADMQVENVNGGFNRTDKQMQVLKLDVEALFEILNVQQSYNASRIGAQIRHTKLKTLEQLYMERQNICYEEGWFHRLLEERLIPYSEETKELLKQRMSKIFDGIKQLNEIAEQLNQHLARTSKLQSHERKALQNWLNDYDKKWARFVKHEIFEDIYQFFLHREINYLSRFWTELKTETNEWAKIQGVSRNASILMSSYVRVTEVLESSFARLLDKYPHNN